MEVTKQGRYYSHFIDKKLRPAVIELCKAVFLNSDCTIRIILKLLKKYR